MPLIPKEEVYWVPKKPEPLRVCITGAAGRNAYCLLFVLAKGAIFGPNQLIILSLNDLPSKEAVGFLDISV